MLIAYGIYKDSPWVMLLVAGIIMMVSSFLLWHLLEKRFLRKSSHYVAEQKS
jgi:peptidoglycan/LPS O-acetylase OafA/YrhL